jgi:hypothetical protein
LEFFAARWLLQKFSDVDIDVVDLVDTYQLVDFLGRSLDLARMCSVVDAVVMVGGEGIFKRVGLAVWRE